MNKLFPHLRLPRCPLRLVSPCRRRYFHYSSVHPNFKPESSPVEYNYIEDIERLERYVPGGYHPVHIGDQFHNRYRVLHKLGHGSYSTTWLARDQKTEKLVAVKVGTADSNPREADILSELSPTNEPTTSAFGQFDISFPPILDRFKIQGTNGLHPCYVTLPARASLSDAREASLKRLFQLNVARALAAQLALSVAFLHSKGLVHGGRFNLRLNNGNTSQADLFRPAFRKRSFESSNRLPRFTRSRIV